LKIILDGKLLSLEAQPVIMNGRTLSPLREIAERMGATVGWEAELGRISLYLGDKYAILYADTPQMTCGTFTSDNTGGINYLTRLAYTLDAAPEIRDGVSFVPIRAVAESLGATVSWESSSQTVYISSPFPAPSPSASAGETPANGSPAYSTMYFQEISAAQAQEWYDMDASFMLYYYSSIDSSSNAVLEWVLSAARDQGLKVYGVDTDSTKFDNTTGQLTFIWNYLDKSSANHLPSLLFVVSPKTATPLVQPKSLQSVEFCMTAFYYNAIYASKPAAPGQGAAPPVPTPGASVDVTGYWVPISIDEAIAKYMKNEKFIHICHNSDDPASNAFMPMLRLAVYRTKAVVYVTDFAGKQENRSWYGYEALNGRQIYAYPTLFFIFNNQQIPYPSVQPGNIQEIMDAFANFKKY
jgi:hypothetical protein